MVMATHLLTFNAEDLRERLALIFLECKFLIDLGSELNLDDAVQEKYIEVKDYILHDLLCIKSRIEDTILYITEEAFKDYPPNIEWVYDYNGAELPYINNIVDWLEIVREWIENYDNSYDEDVANCEYLMHQQGKVFMLGDKIHMFLDFETLITI